MFRCLPRDKQKQLTGEEYDSLITGLGAHARKALLTAECGRVDTSKAVRSALYRKNLIHAGQVLTDEGLHLRAALIARPGSRASRVAQALIDAGFAWAELPGTRPLQALFVIHHPVRVSVRVTFHDKNGAQNDALLDSAHRILLRNGFRTKPMTKPHIGLAVTGED